MLIISYDHQKKLPNHKSFWFGLLTIHNRSNLWIVLMAFDEIEPFDEGRSNQSVILLDQIKLDAFISSVSNSVFFSKHLKHAYSTLFWFFLHVWNVHIQHSRIVNFMVFQCFNLLVRCKVCWSCFNCKCGKISASYVFDGNLRKILAFFQFELLSPKLRCRNFSCIYRTILIDSTNKRLVWWFMFDQFELLSWKRGKNINQTNVQRVLFPCFCEISHGSIFKKVWNEVKSSILAIFAEIQRN